MVPRPPRCPSSWAKPAWAASRTGTAEPIGRLAFCPWRARCARGTPDPLAIARQRLLNRPVSQRRCRVPVDQDRPAPILAARTDHTNDAGAPGAPAVGELGGAATSGACVGGEV